MAETKLIPTLVDVTISGSDIDIRVYYDDTGYTIYFFISNINQVVGGVNFDEGDLGYVIDNLDSVFYISSNGDLVVYDPISTSQYSIDSDGNLILTV